MQGISAHFGSRLQGLEGKGTGALPEYQRGYLKKKKIECGRIIAEKIYTQAPCVRGGTKCERSKPVSDVQIMECGAYSLHY